MNPYAHEVNLERGASGFYKVEDTTYFREVMKWLAVAFLVAGVGTFLIGPFVPLVISQAIGVGLMLTMLLLCFKRSISRTLARVMVIVFPLLMGIMLYPMLYFYLKTDPAVIIMSLVGTAILFGSATVLAFRSEKRMNTKIMFAILIAIIAMSLLNIFLKLTLVSLIISIIAVGLFSVYAFVDMQRLRRGGDGEYPELAAFGIFLDIYNLFVNLMRILGILRS